jgi:hypothetical protein
MRLKRTLVELVLVQELAGARRTRTRQRGSRWWRAATDVREHGGVGELGDENEREAALCSSGRGRGGRRTWARVAVLGGSR